MRSVRLIQTLSFAVISILGAGCSMMSLHPNPDAGPAATAPAALAVPAGNTSELLLVGSGFQIYECRSSDTGFAWTFVAPDAVLYGPGHVLVGKHYGGPTWEHGDGSKVVAKAIAQAPSSSAASIPQLLLQVSSSTGPGALSGTTYVQRLRTVGGGTPTEACDAVAVGRTSRVHYSAEYLFYHAH